MDVGESVTVDVDSRQQWTDTGVQMHLGEQYELTATGRWSDREYESDAGGYESKNALQRLTGWLRRHRTARWFALIGALSQDKNTQFVIGVGTTYRPTTAGVLTCFANDVSFMRGNNHGSISLTVRRVS